MEYASNGKANTALGTGIAGLSLAALNSGLLGNLFGGANACQSSNVVTKDMMELQLQLAASQRDNSILTAELSSEKKMVEVFNAATEKTNKVRDELLAKIGSVESKVDANAAAQAVINCQANSNLTLLNSQIGQLFSLTKMVIPNHNVCPGWGEVNVTPAFAGGTTT